MKRYNYNGTNVYNTIHLLVNDNGIIGVYVKSILFILGGGGEDILLLVPKRVGNIYILSLHERDRRYTQRG